MKNSEFAYKTKDRCNCFNAAFQLCDDCKIEDEYGKFNEIENYEK
jgi:hypothetical protein